MNLISLFQSQGWKVTFASAAAESEHMADLSSLGIDIVPVKINDPGFDNFIRELQPNIVLFDRFMTEEQFGWRVAKYCSRALRILDTEDLHSLRRARQKAVEERRPFKKQDLLTETTSKREVASILRSDLSLIISETEIQLLRELFKIDDALLCYLPFTAPPVDKSEINNWPGFEKRRHFVTVGNFSHPPNLDSVFYLKNDIWPLIRHQLPDAEMHIYGAYPTQKVKQLHKPEEGFHIRGRAKDAKEVVRQARICLAPLRFGAGLKGKLLEAMQCGTPSVTTDIGAEGMDGDLEWCGRIGNEASCLASAAVELYSNPAKWKEAQKQGARIINKRFVNQKHAGKLIDRILSLSENLEQHRLQNFTGSMLRHHTMASTEYMSRWIEEKNKS